MIIGESERGVSTLRARTMPHGGHQTPHYSALIHGGGGQQQQQQSGALRPRSVNSSFDGGRRGLNNVASGQSVDQTGYLSDRNDQIVYNRINGGNNANGVAGYQGGNRGAR